MEQDDIRSQLNKLEQKVDAIWRSVEKTRKYFLIVIWVSILLIVLPMIGLVFIIPSFIDTYMNSLNGLL